MTRLLLCRHGRSVWNAQGRIQGRADPPLDGVGREQARRLAERLREEDVVALFTSPQRRAQETAEIVGRALDVPVVPDERLREHDVGDLTGLTWEQVWEQYPEFAQAWAEAREEVQIPGADTYGPFRTQVVAAFCDILSRYAEGSVGVVTHGGTLGTYLNHLIGLPTLFSPFRFANGSLSVVEVNPLRPRIVLLNDVCHLGGDP